jgi:phosphatidate cytidylyltransferase
VLWRTWIGGLLAAGLAGLLWIADQSDGQRTVLWVGTALSGLGLVELERMFRGRGLVWVLLPPAVALLVLNAALTAPRSLGAARFTPPELAASYLVVLLAAAAALLEARATPWKRPYLALLFAALALGLLAFPGFSSALEVDWPAALALCVPLVAVLLLARTAGPPLRRADVAAPLAAAAWLLVPLPALAHVEANFGFLGLVSLIVLSKIGDIAGYYAGSAFGRVHPFKRLSPGKTLEGCLASALAGALAGIACVLVGWLPDSPFGWKGGLAAGLLVNLAAQAGDLAESWVKRRAGVKDSSRLLGPSGGVLDVVDSLLGAVPAALAGWPLLFT